MTKLAVELVRTRKKATVAYFNAMSEHLHGGTEETHDTPYSEQEHSNLRTAPGASRQQT